MKQILASEARTRLGGAMLTEHGVNWERQVSQFIDSKLGGNVYLEFGKTSGIWADEATVYVNEHMPTKGGVVTYKIEISWSSTHRTPSMAAAAIANYQAALALANHLQAIIDCLPTVVANVCQVCEGCADCTFDCCNDCKDYCECDGHDCLHENAEPKECRHCGHDYHGKKTCMPKRAPDDVVCKCSGRP